MKMRQHQCGIPLVVELVSGHTGVPVTRLGSGFDQWTQICSDKYSLAVNPGKLHFRDNRVSRACIHQPVLVGRFDPDDWRCPAIRLRNHPDICKGRIPPCPRNPHSVNNHAGSLGIHLFLQKVSFEYLENKEIINNPFLNISYLFGKLAVVR